MIGTVLQQLSTHWRLFACAMLAAVLCGCATGPNADPRDPLEPYNRAMTKVNTAVDDAVLKPVSTFYVEATPSLVRRGVSNFFGNLGDAWSFVNNVLQGKPTGALSSFWRVMINTTIGLGGILDPASEMRLSRYREDLGQTLGYWGVPPGPFLVLPLLGPSTLRDTAALPVDFKGQPQRYVFDVPTRNSLSVLRIVDTRSHLLGATNLLEAAALDPYSFQRDAFLQARRNDVYDGNPPPQDDPSFPADDQPVRE